MKNLVKGGIDLCPPAISSKPLQDFVDLLNQAIRVFSAPLKEERMGASKRNDVQVAVRRKALDKESQGLNSKLNGIAVHGAAAIQNEDVFAFHLFDICLNGFVF